MDEERTPASVEAVEAATSGSEEEAKERRGITKRGTVRHGHRTVPVPDGAARQAFSPEQRLLILDSWLRSDLPATTYASLVGVSCHTLYAWKKRFDQEGPAGLEDHPRPNKGGSRLSEATRRAILLMKQTHPDWGSDRIHHMLIRSEGCSASPNAILRVLRESGYETIEEPTRPHAPVTRRFERSRPNQLWQTDLFTFLLKRENRRLYLVAYLDDFSRYIVGWGLHASSSGALVREALESAIARYGAPEEVLTDQGAQYHTWRGKSGFRKLLDRRGIRQIVARARHPQTLGKTERFWGTLWRECLETADLRGLEDVRTRIGHFIDHYNFQRPHQGLDGLVPADRYFEAESAVRKTLEARVSANARDLALHGAPRSAFYLTGRIGGESIALHGEDERVVLTREDGRREEVDLTAPGRRVRPGEPSGMPEPASTPTPGSEEGSS